MDPSPKDKGEVTLSCPTVTPWAVAYHAPLSMEFSRQEYWSGLPIPSPGDLPNAGIESGSLALQENSSLSEPPYFNWCIVKAGSIETPRERWRKKKL